MTYVCFYIYVPGSGGGVGGVHITEMIMLMPVMHDGQSMIILGSLVDKQTEPKPKNCHKCLHVVEYDLIQSILHM